MEANAFDNPDEARDKEARGGLGPRCELRWFLLPSEKVNGLDRRSCNAG